MRSLIYLITFIVYTLPVFGQSQWANYVNDHIIYATAVEGDIVWVGSQGGLTKINRVTGEKQSFLPSNSGMKGFGIQSILVEDDGTKWLGGENGGLMRFDGTDWEAFTYINTGDTLISISKIQQAPNGDIWLKSVINGNCSGCPKVFRYDGSSFERMDNYFGIGNPNNGSGAIQDFDIAANGDVWVYAYSYQQGFEYYIQQFSGGAVVASYNPTDIGLLPDEYISRIMVSQTGEVYCMTTQYSFQLGNKTRLRALVGSTWALVPIQGEDSVSGYPYYFFKSEDGNIYMQFTDTNTNETIFKRFNGSTWTGWDENDLVGLPPGYGPNLLNVDAEGHWWINNYSIAGIHAPKLFEYDGTAFKAYDTEFFPLMFNYVNAVAVDCEGNTWFGGDGLNKFDGTNWTDFDANAIGTAVNAWSMTMDQENCVLWVASYGITGTYGVVSYDGNVFKKYNTGGSAFKVKIASDGTVWVATTSNGLGRFDGTNWTWFNESNSPLANWVYDIALDASDGVWAATYENGLVHWDGNTWQQFNESNSPVNNYSSLIYIDAAGMVWTHNNDGDLLRFDGQNWQTIPTNPQGYVNRIIEESPGKYWIALSGGALLWDGNTFEKYEVANSQIGSNYVWDIYIDPYGNKWFTNLAGVSVFNENGISNRLINPPYGVTGTVFFDTDQDGNQAPTGEPGLPGQQITLQPDNITTYSTHGGFYKLHPTPGNHQITIQPDAPYVPTTATTLDLLMGNDDQSSFDFGAWTANPPDSLGLDITAGRARCSETTTVWVQATNFGLFDVAGTVTLEYDPLASFVSADPAPTSMSGNSLTWDFSGLSPYEYSPFKVIFQNPNADFVGEWLDFTTTAVASGSGQSISDAAATEVRCSFDPNEKHAAPTGESVAQYSLLGDALDYTIFFQNKGNDTAFIVIIRDTLDSDLDAASFQLLSNSHPVRVERQGTVLTFFFENINLLWEATDEPASHGFVKYRIRPNTGLPDPTDIQNTAHIYFDFNPAIVTNTTVNTLVETLPFLATDEPVVRPTILISPNPNSGSFWVETSGEGPWTATVSDLSGRVVRQLSSLGKKASVEGLASGFYIVTIKQDGLISNEKVMVGN